MMADVNGDGLQDVVGFAGSGVNVSLSTGTGFTEPSLWAAAYGSNANAGSWINGQHPRMMADVNGDGLQGVVGFGGGGTFVSIAEGSPGGLVSEIMTGLGSVSLNNLQAPH